MDVAITKVSSKGQIVIPSNMRKDISIGDEFIIIKEENKLIESSITLSFEPHEIKVCILE